MANLKFAIKKKTHPLADKKCYKILLVDDDEMVHKVSSSVIGNMAFKTFDLNLISVYSAREAKTYLENNDDVALAFIDVVMETPNAGLQLVKQIREELDNHLIRLVIRTGQANEAPQMDIVEHYDIDDYKEKTELTVQKLYTTIRTSIRSYIQLVELQKKYEETYKQMTLNPITTLPNRIKLQEDLVQNNAKILVLIDIIGFSVINETNGYEVGDKVLRKLADYLRTKYKNRYDIYHLGADLFGLLLPTSPQQHIEQTISIIKNDIAKFRIKTGNFNRSLNTTIGVAYQGEKNTMQKAILALNDAKNSGRNQITYYSDDLKIIKKIQNTHYWGGILKKAIENNRILAYYQPICDTITQEIYKYEMLVRLENNGKIYTPYHFLEAARNSGQLFDIFKFMFTTACQQVSQKRIRVSINIGDMELSHPYFMMFIKTKLLEHLVDTSLITIEVLEYNSISEHHEIKKRIIELHQLGFEIDIDDFGTRCSNFAQIENLPITMLKIDGQYIKDLDRNRNSMIVVKTIQKYTKAKSLKVVAEFVHSQAVYEIVKEIGIDYVQGYYLHEPKAKIADNEC